MSSEAWFRNPLKCIRELAEMNVTNIVWDRGVLVSRSIDAQRHLESNFPSAVDYRILLVGEQGTAELRRGQGFTKPFAVYPTWEYGQPLVDLLDMIENPVGKNVAACSDNRVPPDERPVLGQEHRVVVTSYPDPGTRHGRAFLHQLADIQDEYGNCIIHVHGSYSYRIAFGMGFRSADVNPVDEAAIGNLILGNGKKIKWEDADHYRQWVNLVNFSTTDLAVPRMRCMFNIKSALWAKDNYFRDINFLSIRTPNRSLQVDPTDPNPQPATTSSPFSSTPAWQPGDKITCDTCSATAQCKYSRDGAVCSLPKAETAELVSYFGRDADKVITGTGKLIQAMVRRSERGMAREDEEEILDPEVTKALNSATVNAMKLAKILDPRLAAPMTKVGVFINNGQQTAVPTASKNVIMGRAVAALEAQGISRDDITQEMIDRFTSQAALAIEAKASGD